MQALSEFAPTMEVVSGAYEIFAAHGPKLVKLGWPVGIASEVYFDFIENGDVILSESVEYYEGELAPEQIADVARTVANFLLHPTKLVEFGRFFTRKQLQYQEGLQWKSVF